MMNVKCAVYYPLQSLFEILFLFSNFQQVSVVGTLVKIMKYDKLNCEESKKFTARQFFILLQEMSCKPRSAGSVVSDECSKIAIFVMVPGHRSRSPGSEK
jgi:hypothetical protein